MTNAPTEQRGFRREMGLFDGINLVVGIMVGSGVFYIGAYILQHTTTSPVLYFCFGSSEANYGNNLQLR